MIQNNTSNHHFFEFLKSIVPDFIKTIKISLHKSASNKQFNLLLTKHEFLKNIDNHIKENHK